MGKIRRIKRHHFISSENIQFNFFTMHRFKLKCLRKIPEKSHLQVVIELEIKVLL